MYTKKSKQREGYSQRFGCLFRMTLWPLNNTVNNYMLCLFTMVRIITNWLKNCHLIQCCAALMLKMKYLSSMWLKSCIKQTLHAFFQCLGYWRTSKYGLAISPICQFSLIVQIHCWKPWINSFPDSKKMLLKVHIWRNFRTNLQKLFDIKDDL